MIKPQNKETEHQKSRTADRGLPPAKNPPTMPKVKPPKA